MERSVCYMPAGVGTELRILLEMNSSLGVKAHQKSDLTLLQVDLKTDTTMPTHFLQTELPNDNVSVGLKPKRTINHAGKLTHVIQLLNTRVKRTKWIK